MKTFILLFSLIVSPVFAKTKAPTMPKADADTQERETIQVLGNFFVVPQVMPFEIEGKLKFTRSAEWIGVDPKTCMQVPVQLKINQGKAEFGGADGPYNDWLGSLL